MRRVVHKTRKWVAVSSFAALGVAIMLLPLMALGQDGGSREPDGPMPSSAYVFSDSPYLRIPNEWLEWPPVRPPENGGAIESGQDPFVVESYDLSTRLITRYSPDKAAAVVTQAEDAATVAYYGLLPSKPQLETVFTPDDRSVPADTTAFPWRSIVKIYMTFPNGASGWGSGAIIGQGTGNSNGFHVLTAGHVVYSQSDGGWATVVTVVPGESNGYAPYGYATPTNMRSYTGWTVNQSDDHDWALLTLDRRIGNFTGFMGRKTMWSIDGLYTGLLNTAGYPGDRDNGQRMYWGRGQWSCGERIPSLVLHGHSSRAERLTGLAVLFG